MKKQKNILIRTAGGKAPGKEIGFGHLYRTMNLAKELRKHNVYFMINDYSKAAIILKNNNFKKIISLKKELTLKDDIAKTINFIYKNKIDIIIIDKYKISRKYVSSIKRKCFTVMISDLNIIDYDSDLLINGFIGFKNKIIKNKFNSTCLLGPAYQILHKKFQEKRIKQKKIDLLISVGGFDEKGVSEIVLKTIQNYLSEMQIKVILGPGTKKSKFLKNLEKKFPNNLSIVNETNLMAYEIATARYGISSGGLTSYEFAAMNIPFGIICQARHQLQTAKEWEKNGYGINLGVPGSSIHEKIQKFVLKIIKNKDFRKIRKTKLIDGFGSARVSKQILSLYESSKPKKNL